MGQVSTNKPLHCQDVVICSVTTSHNLARRQSVSSKFTLGSVVKSKVNLNCELGIYCK